MLQVASDLSIQAHNLALRPPRPAQQPDREASPFESLLDESAQAAEPPPPDDKGPPSDGANRVQGAKVSDNKSAPGKENEVPAKPDDTGAVDETNDGNRACGADERKANTKFIQTDIGDAAAKPAANGKPAEDRKDKAACDQPDCAGEIPVTDAIAVALAPVAPTPDQERNVVNLPDQAAPAADVATQSKPIDLELLKTVVGKQGDNGKQVDGKKQPDTGAQADGDQVADEFADGATLTGKPASQSSTESKLQAPAGQSGQHVSQARGEFTDNGVRAGSDAPAAPSADVGSATIKGIPDGGATPTISTQPHAASNAADTPALLSQRDPQPVPVPLAGLAIEIAGKALAGKNRFEIRLDPPELGRIEVRLDVDRDGNVTSRLTVDRAETFDLLRRDAASLERALQDAGLKTADNGLQFSLRDQSMNQEQASERTDTAQLIVQDDVQPPVDLISQNYGRPAGQGNGLDIRV